MDRQIRLPHHGVGPHDPHELALADQLSRALHQDDQDVQRPTAETHGPVPLHQQPLCREQ